MKIILREHVDHLGVRGDVVSVARGYARNYLLPKKLAFEATPGNMLQIKQQRRVWDARETKEVADAEALAARIGECRLSISMKAGESGTLYGSVTNSDVARLLKERGIEIDRKRIVLDPVKSLGSQEVTVKLHPKVKALVSLQVVAEDAQDARNAQD